MLALTEAPEMALKPVSGGPGGLNLGAGSSKRREWVGDRKRSEGVGERNRLEERT